MPNGLQRLVYLGCVRIEKEGRMFYLEQAGGRSNSAERGSIRNEERMEEPTHHAGMVLTGPVEDREQRPHQIRR